MKNSFEPILESLHFDEKEKALFFASIQLVKSEQIDDNINATLEIFNLIKEYSKYAISKD